jgi:polyvinyl alcohol dehydrogenase (cytochrome)
MEWGTAFDGTRIYLSITNQHHIPYRLTENGSLTSTAVTGGSWAALDPATGKIIWQTADPGTEVVGGSTVGVWDLAPVSVANGVVYAASMAHGASSNEFYALDAATGQVLWSAPAQRQSPPGGNSSVNAAPAIVNSTVYWGTGYSRSGPVEGSGGNELYAFGINGNTH